MRYVIGGSLVVLGGLVVFGAVTGRLPAMIAALVKPEDLTDSTYAKLKREGGAVAGTGSTPDVKPPPDVTNNYNQSHLE